VHSFQCHEFDPAFTSTIFYPSYSFSPYSFENSENWWKGIFFQYSPPPPLPTIHRSGSWTNLLKGTFHQAVSVLGVKIINKTKKKEKKQCIRAE